MNIALWVLQILIALHTLIGAIWKFSNSAEQTMPTLKAIPPTIWMGLGIVEIICAIALVLPIFKGGFSRFVPIAASLIAVEMLSFCGIHIFSGDPNYSPTIYWAVVAALCVFIAYGRLKLKPN